MMKKLLLIIPLVCLLTGCSIGRKSWGMAMSADAFRVIMGDPRNGGIAPEVNAGGGSWAGAFQTSYDDGRNYPTMISYARRKSMWGCFSSADSGNISFIYIAGSNETPEQTVEIINAFAGAVNESGKKLNKLITEGR